MNTRESLRIAWRSITSHKLRSTLTTLGVIIGVAAVITFMVLGGAFTADIVGGLEDYDEPSMMVSTQTTPPDGFGLIFVDSPIYTEHDIDQLEQLDDVKFVAPIDTLAVTQVAFGEERITGALNVEATTASLFEFDEFVDGDPFTDGSNQTVLNEQAAKAFEENVTVGDSITLTHRDGSKDTVEVAGIIREPIELGAEPTVYVPVDSFSQTVIETPRDTTEPAYSTLIVGASDLDAVSSVKPAVETYLQEDSDASELKGEDDEIAVQTVEDAIEQISDIIGQLTVFIAGIAAIALVVGSIGIANIMIVSVTERTREIGIMKAIGATRRDIVQLFLVESTILGVIGSFLGVLLGLGVGVLAVNFLDWPMHYPIHWVLIAVIVGVAVGIVSGLYPAWRAAKTDPIEALRYE